MGCPFCPIEKKSEWYLYDGIWRVVACQDLKARDYKYRILVVGSGPPSWHRPWKDYTKEEKVFLRKLAIFIAGYHIEIGKAKELVQIDTEHFSIKDHGHVQACMR